MRAKASNSLIVTINQRLSTVKAEIAKVQEANDVLTPLNIKDISTLTLTDPATLAAGLPVLDHCSLGKNPSTGAV